MHAPSRCISMANKMLLESDIVDRAPQSWEWVDGSRVMGQMGHENRMGHMGHGSLGVDP